MTNQHFGQESRGSRISPIPRARHGFPSKKKGTSAPSPVARSCISGEDKGLDHISLRARRVAAASLLPPPMPAATGICLNSFMETPSRSPVREKKDRAALNTRLLSSAGTGIPSQASFIPPPRAIVSSRRSKRSIGAIMDTKSW